jgi:hypothetical protein
MTRRALLLPVLLAACACGNASSDGHRVPAVPDATYKVPQEVFAETLSSFPHGREGKQELALDVTERADGRYLVVLTISGLLDDSVAGEQHRAVLRPVDGGWRVAELGERWRCQPGRGSASWTTQPCH